MEPLSRVDKKTAEPFKPAAFNAATSAKLISATLPLFESKALPIPSLL